MQTETVSHAPKISDAIVSNMGETAPIDSFTAPSSLADVLIAKLPNIDKPWDFEHIPLREMVREIQNGTYSSAIARIRQHVRKGDEDASRKVKKTLPSYSITGQYNERVDAGNFKSFSGLVSIDYDKMPNAEAFKAEISKNPSTAVAFISPSGRGLKIGFHVASNITNDSEFKIEFAKLTQYLEALYPNEAKFLDRKCKDIRRVCFLSWDESIYTNYNAVPLDLSGFSAPEVIRKPTAPIPNRQAAHPARIEAALQFVTDYGYESWTMVLNAIKHEMNDTDQAFELFHTWSMKDVRGYKGESDCRRTWDSFNRDGGNVITIGSLFHIAKENGWRFEIGVATALKYIGDTDKIDDVVTQVVELVQAGLPKDSIDDVVDAVISRGKLGRVKGKLIDKIKAGIKKLPKGELMPASDITLDGMTINASREFKATSRNLHIALEHPEVFGIDAKLDEFSGSMYYQIDGGDWRPADDNGLTKIRIHLAEKSFAEIDPKRIRPVLDLIGETNRFDSAQDWLNSLEWDGIPRVAALAARYWGCTDNAYSKAVSEYTMTALAGRILVPGVKCDIAPIMVGDQGAKKSTAVKTLVPSEQFFAEISFDQKDADIGRLMKGKLIIELNELRGLRFDSNQESIKALMTRSTDEWVTKFKESTTRIARRGIFIGTTNKPDCLFDTTGNRRWAPIKVGEINIEALTADREQLWAEAAILFKEHGVLWQDVERLARNEHAEFEGSDDWEEAVREWVFRPTADGGTDIRQGFSTSDLFVPKCIEIEFSKRKPQDTRRVESILQKLGFKSTRPRNGYGPRPRIWKFEK